MIYIVLQVTSLLGPWMATSILLPAVRAKVFV
jgi:hypothetical protein